MLRFALVSRSGTDTRTRRIFPKLTTHPPLRLPDPAHHQVDMSDLDALAIAAAAAASSEKPMIREIERIRKERQREADARAAAARKAVLRNEKLAEKNRLKRVFDRSKELAEYRRKVDARLREAEAVLREARVAAETEEKLTRFARIYADLVIKKYEEQEKAAGKGTADSADGGFTPLTGRMAQQRDKAIKGLETVMGACRSVVEFHARTQERIAAIAETKAAWAEGSKGKGKGKGKEGEEAEGPDDFGDEDFEDTAVRLEGGGLLRIASTLCPSSRHHLRRATFFTESNVETWGRRSVD